MVGISQEVNAYKGSSLLKSDTPGEYALVCLEGMLLVALRGSILEKELTTNKECSSCDSLAIASDSKKAGVGSHADHSAAKKRINRIKGQLDAVSRMVDEREYCPNIIQQIRAATSALRGLEAEVLRSHLRGCVKNAFASEDPHAVDTKIDEILKLWSK